MKASSSAFPSPAKPLRSSSWGISTSTRRPRLEARSASSASVSSADMAPLVGRPYSRTGSIPAGISTASPVDSPEAAAGAEAAEAALPAAEPAAAGECPDWADGAEAEAPGALESWSKTAGRLVPAPASVSQRASSSRA